MSPIYDYLILGAGMTGVTFGRLLQLAGVDNFFLLEAASEAGGLCRTKEINGHVLDIGGGHFLCTKYKEVYDFVFAHIPREDFNSFQRVSKVALEGELIDYPVESNIWQLSPARCVDYLLSVIQNGESRGLPPPSNFEQWIRWKLGDKVADAYMLPYNRKIWGVTPAEMDIDWLHKIPRLDIRQIAQACVSRTSDRAAMPSHSTFYYPKRGGFQRIFDAIADPIRDRIACNVPVARIERQGDVLVVDGRYRARRIVTTIPWHYLSGSPIFDPATAAAIKRLRANEIVVSLHEGAGDPSIHWTYLPDLALEHHRVFYIHNFAPHSKRSGEYRETNAIRWSGTVPSLFHHRNEYAYPIPALGWAQAIGQVSQAAQAQGVYGLGRWGQWQYFNSDVCIWEAMRLANELGHSRWQSALGSRGAASAAAN